MVKLFEIIVSGDDTWIPTHSAIIRKAEYRIETLGINSQKEIQDTTFLHEK